MYYFYSWKISNIINFKTLIEGKKQAEIATNKRTHLGARVLKLEDNWLKLKRSKDGIEFSVDWQLERNAKTYNLPNLQARSRFYR